MPVSVSPAPPPWSSSTITTQESPSTPFVFNDDFNDVSPSNPRWNAPLPSLDDEELMGFLA